MYAVKPNIKPPIQQKKYRCKVCFDFGKSEREYNSHSTKNSRGEVTCPCLLKTECKYCFKKGHMAKYCSKREEDEKRTQKSINMPAICKKIEPIPSKVENKKPNNYSANAYNLLMEEEEDDNTSEISSSVLELPAIVCPPPPKMSRFRKCVLDVKTGKQVVYMLDWNSSAYDSDPDCEDYDDESMWFRIN